jgi:hypothetical protein
VGRSSASYRSAPLMIQSFRVKLCGNWRPSEPIISASSPPNVTVAIE